MEQYLARAHQVLDTGQLALEHGDYISAVNRAYYAIFYAANALLATKGLERSKHSGVIAAFRQHFVKTGIVDVGSLGFRRANTCSVPLLGIS